MARTYWRWGLYIFGQSENSTNTSITGVDMSKATKLRVIGDRAFSSCRALTSITLPSGLTSIGESAFKGCRGLTRITLPSSLTTSSASSLTSITSTTFQNTPFTSSTMTAIIKHPSGAAYKTADEWKDLQATFEAQ